MGEEASLSLFFKQVKKREWSALNYFGGAVMPGPKECDARQAVVEEARDRELMREKNKIIRMAETRPVSEMTDDEIDDCIDVIHKAVTNIEMPGVSFSWAMDTLDKLYAEQNERLRARIANRDRAAARALYAREAAEEEAREELKAERKTKSKKGKKK